MRGWRQSCPEDLPPDDGSLHAFGWKLAVRGSAVGHVIVCADHFADACAMGTRAEKLAARKALLLAVKQARRDL